VLAANLSFSALPSPRQPGLHLLSLKGSLTLSHLALDLGCHHNSWWCQAETKPSDCCRQ
jgi:hypothetical protein